MDVRYCQNGTRFAISSIPLFVFIDTNTEKSCPYMCVYIYGYMYKCMYMFRYTKVYVTIYQPTTLICRKQNWEEPKLQSESHNFTSVVVFLHQKVHQQEVPNRLPCFHFKVVYSNILIKNWENWKISPNTTFPLDSNEMFSRIFVNAFRPLV